MTFRSLSACVRDLERSGHLTRVPDLEIDPRLELASVQRRAYRKGSPALLFPRVKGSPFPVLANLFGTRERARHIFRHSLRRVEALLRLKADPHNLFRRPWQYAATPLTLLSMLPRQVKSGPILEGRTSLSRLPQFVSWPKDGGGYITLPQVYTEHPAHPGFFQSNLGMYRVQMSGNDFIPDEEAGLHYQIHRGIGPHHMAALERGRDLRVNIFVGGPPALTMAAIMPLPEGIPELYFAGALAGHRIPMITPEKNGTLRPYGLAVPAEADFCICGYLPGKNMTAPTKPEGPFGDHLGYYSLAHDFPLLKVDAVFHRPDAVWPFTSVGRPPQEDTVFGEFIHELTADLVPTVFSGVHQVHAVDAAGVHPLLLAVGSERYVPFAGTRMPQELLTCGMSLFGSTQTSLAKYLLIAAHEDQCPGAHLVPEFLAHMLRRTDFSRDLHFITRTTMDTLDYSGISLNQGSKLLWAAAGLPLRELSTEIPAALTLPAGFPRARLFAPGILVCQGPRHVLPRDTQGPAMRDFGQHIARVLRPQAERKSREHLPTELALIVVVDDADFTSRDWDTFLWVAFTRSDPATDLYGANERSRCKHWGCDAPLIMDARMKSFHAPPLEEDSEVERRIDVWAARGGPLHGLV